MKHFKHSETGDRGWFIGCFDKAVIKTNDVEVCYSTVPKGFLEPHYHKICTETVLIISGKIKMHNKVFGEGDIVVLDPGEINDTEYLEETKIIGVKTPAGGNDKILVKNT